MKSLPDIHISLWPWGLFVFMLCSWVSLLVVTNRLGSVRVNDWLFSHRDHLPLPFLAVGVLTRLASSGLAPGVRRHWMEWIGLLLIVVGEGMRIWAVGIVGAATRSSSVNAKRLVESGPYAIIRNPIYMGNFLVVVGLACLAQSWAAVMACAFYFLVVYRRIIYAEERFLLASFGACYEAFCRRVPRLLPTMRWSWEHLRAPFSLRELRKEYQTITGIVVAAIIIHLTVVQPWRGWRAGWLEPRLRPPADTSSTALSGTQLSVQAILPPSRQAS